MKTKLACALIFLTLKFLQAQDQYTNSIGMEFILVPKGEFVLGRFHPTVSRMISWGSSEPLNESIYKSAMELASRDTMPGFPVKIPYSFYIGKYEVTQGQWKQIMGKNPSYFKSNVVDDNPDLHPVENVSWKDANRFIKKLNRKEKGKAHYRLPTEFEWEYAARAGKTDDISWAEIQATAIIAQHTTSMVGKRTPNDWGLYDMLGNVWEWVQDYYNEKLFADPEPPSTGTQHVLKGAPFYGDVKNATYMTHAAGPGSGYDTGFRIICKPVFK